MTEFIRATAKIPPSFSFDGRFIRAGDEIACGSRMMADTLLKIGCFERVEKRTDVAAFVYPVPDALKAKPKRGRPPKSGYSRRDMRAAD